jgi:hypothetical protein
MVSIRTLILPVTLVLLARFAGAQEAEAGAAVSNAAPAADQAPTDKRAFGVLPNYGTVEGSTPFTPLTSRQKLRIATKDTIDGPSYAMAGLFAGLYQLEDQNPSFGQGMKGYARRYVSAIADQDIGNYMTEGFLPVLLSEDPRYFRRGTGSVKGRILYAASRVALAKTDKGNPTFNFSEFLGNGVTASIGNAYYPDEVGLVPTLTRMFTQIGTDAVSNVLKEFWPDVKRKFFKHKA